jgi:hypothetical protein
VQTVIETGPFIKSAADAGMTDAEIEALITLLAADPMAGEVMAGTGGCRKLRVAGRGKGKSGGYRVVTFYIGDDIPVFLLAAFSKGDQANLSKHDRNLLAELTKELVAEFRK